MNIKGQSFLKLLDFTPEQIAEFLVLAAELKAKKKAGIPHRLCEGKQAALIFEKTSTRTRCSFEVAAHDLGMTVTYLDPSGSQIGKKESIADTARVLGRIKLEMHVQNVICPGQRLVQLLRVGQRMHLLRDIEEDHIRGVLRRRIAQDQNRQAHLAAPDLRVFQIYDHAAPAHKKACVIL